MSDNVLTVGEKMKPLVPTLAKNFPMHHRIKAFIAHYIANGNNGKQAAVQAGYKSPQSASNRLLKNQQVLQEIARIQEENLKAIRPSKDDFLANVYEELKNAKQESTRARLLQLISDILGYSKPKDEAEKTSIYDLLQGAKALFTTQQAPLTQVAETKEDTEQAKLT